MTITKEQIDELYQAVLACDIGDIYEGTDFRSFGGEAVDLVKRFDEKHKANIADVNKALDLVRALFTN